MRKLVSWAALALLIGIVGVQHGFAREPSGKRLSISISGPLHVKGGSVCTYSASVSGGSGYEIHGDWYLGYYPANPIGSGQSIQVTIPQGNHVGLGHTVYDGEDEFYDYVILTISDEGDDCTS